MRLIVPMGGRGTRLRPFSHTTPKALLPVAGQPAIARSLGAFADALPRPVDEVAFVLNPTDRAGDVPDELEAACAAIGVRARFAVQTEPLGTAHAVASAGDLLDGEVLTVWSDTLFRAARRADLDGGGGGPPLDLMAWTIDVEDPRRFGVVTRGDDGRVSGLLEKPPDARFTETLVGAYYVRDGAALRRQIDGMMARGEPGAGGEYQLTDALDGLVHAGARVGTEPVDEWLDVGTVPAYLDAVFRTLDRAEPPPHRAGVTFVPPVYVAPGAHVASSTVGPYVSLEAGARVEGSTLRHAVLFADAVVRDSQLDGAVVGRRATAAGYAGGVLLGDDASAGEPVRAQAPTS